MNLNADKSAIRHWTVISSRRASVVVIVLTVTCSVLVSPPSGASHSVPLSDCVNPDNGDPLLRGLSITPRTIDTSRQGARVTVRARVSDTGGPGDPSGIASGSALLTRKERWAGEYVALHDSGNGIWEGTAIFAAGSYPGSWRTKIRFYDRAGNKQVYTSGSLRALDMDSELSVKSVLDTQPPDLVDLTLPTHAVDTRKEVKTVRISARLSDNLGVARVKVYLEGKHYRGREAVVLSLVRGTPRLGTWAGELQLSSLAGSGTVRVAVKASPRAGAPRRWSSAELASQGLDSEFDILSNDLIDTAAPTVSLIRVTPANVDVRTADATFEVSARLQDAESGVVSADVDANSNYQEEGEEYHRFYLQRVSGTAQDGIWRGTVTIYRCEAPEPVFHLESLRVTDRAGRRNYVSASTLAVNVLADDRTPPSFHLNQTGADPGTLRVAFDEAVTGISTQSIHVLLDAEPPRVYRAISGSWSCKDETGTATDCLRGHPREALFTPDVPLDISNPDFEYQIRINPEHSLAVTDLQGNAPRRESAGYGDGGCNCSGPSG